jgi:SAM-dependent methyltransferase
LKLHRPTTELLRGLKGLEIGRGAWNDYGLDALNVSPKELDDLQHERTPIDIDAFGDNIPVSDNSQDFVFSSHVLEHMPDMIRALREWNRVVKPGGYVVMIVPLRTARRNDRGKPVTTWEHVMRDYVDAVTIDTHPFDPKTDYRGGHYHVFTIASLTDMICRIPGLNWDFIGAECPDTKNRNGFWIAYRVNK